MDNKPQEFIYIMVVCFNFSFRDRYSIGIFILSGQNKNNYIIIEYNY